MRTKVTLCTAAILLSGLIVHWWYAPMLRITQDNPEVVSVDVRMLGAYQTTVNRIRLYNEDQGTIVWELAAQNDDVQIHQFILKTGDNPVVLSSVAGKYSVIVPKGADRFALHKGTKYRLELSSGYTLLSKSSASFEFGGS